MGEDGEKDDHEEGERDGAEAAAEGPEKDAGRPAMPCDCVDQMARPLAKVMTASVARKGGMRRRATATPFTRPTATPTASMARAPATALPGTSPPASVITRAPATLARATTAVTERSMPPVRRTRVWPRATARRGRTFESTFARLGPETRPGTNGERATR